MEDPLEYHPFSVYWHSWWTLSSLCFGRNCGNVFCAACCYLKLPIPDQQLYDPVLVCNSCYEHIQVSRARELMSQHLKKPIATASSWMPEMTCPVVVGLKGGSAPGLILKVPWCGSQNCRAQRYCLEKSSLVPWDWSSLAGGPLPGRLSPWGYGPNPDPESGSLMLSWWLWLLSLGVTRW